MADAQNRRRKVRMIASLSVVAVCAFIVLGGWATIAVIGSRDWDSGHLQMRGTFGDSFGALSAICSGFAFVGAAYAVYLQREQLIRQAESEQADEVETRFFQLLASFQSAVNSTRVGEVYQGRQALRKIADWLLRAQIGNREHLHAGPDYPLAERRADINRWYLRFYYGTRKAAPEEGWVHEPAGDLLGHLFRQMYHIVRYVDGIEWMSDDRKKFYIRILRAHLSNPELVLLHYNGLSDHGYQSFHPLIERHDLLQNINIGALPDPDDRLLYPSLANKAVPEPHSPEVE